MNRVNDVAGDGFSGPLKVDGILGRRTNDRLRDVLTYRGTAPLLSGLRSRRGL